MDKEAIIKEIQRTAKENGGTPLGSQRFANETGIKKSDWYGKYWSTWGDAVKEAGYEPNVFVTASDIELLIRKLIELIREIGRFPTHGELRLKTFKAKTFPAHSTFDARMGKKKHEKAKKIVEYCNKHEGLEDVIDICLPLCSSENRSKDSEIENKVDDFGFVYLMKSGKHYKIGRSNSADRREYELKTSPSRESGNDT